MGIYVQDTYAKYGNHWQENLFYSHLISIPLFLPLQPMLSGQYERLRGSPPTQLPASLAPYVPVAAQRLAMRVPTSIFHLAVNSLTQLACISGVNLLGSRSSAVTVTIVLNIRKLASFILSVWLFGNKLSGLMVVGAVLVFWVRGAVRVGDVVPAQAAAEDGKEVLILHLQDGSVSIHVTMHSRRYLCRTAE